ncbi:MAG: DUF748 domain-containing protein [Acidobacteriota bacterium]
MSSRRLKIALVVGLVASVLVVGLLWLNLSRLMRKFAQERIPGLSIGEVQVAWNRVQLTDFRYLSGVSLVTSIGARSVDAHPTFLSFLDPEIEVRQLVIKSPQFRLVRQPEEKPGAAVPRNSPAVPPSARADFKQITLVSGSGEIEDRTVSGPPARLALDRIEVQLQNLKYPMAAGATEIDASCIIKGQPDGTAHLTGWLEAVNQSAELKLEASRLDLKNLRPYLRDRVHTIENADGTADLHLDLSMAQGVYTAEGQLTLADLRLASRDQAPTRLPALLLAQYLKVHNNHVTVPFKLTGDLRKKEHRLDLAALLSGIINQEIGNEALQKKIGLPKRLEALDEDLRNLKEKARQLRKLF